MTDSVIRAPSVRVSAYSSQYILSSFGPAAYHADALPERAVCSAAGHRSRPDVRRLASRIRTGTLTATSPLHDTVRTVCTCPISYLCMRYVRLRYCYACMFGLVIVVFVYMRYVLLVLVAAHPPALQCAGLPPRPPAVGQPPGDTPRPRPLVLPTRDVDDARVAVGRAPGRWTPTRRNT